VHLGANPEARWGLERTRLDLEQGTITTYNVLEAMRRTGVKKLIFSSSGTVYGDTDKVCAEGDLGELPLEGLQPVRRLDLGLMPGRDLAHRGLVLCRQGLEHRRLGV